MEFTEEQIERYSRHIILPEVGGEGQQKILNAKVLIVGLGGLGSPVSLYLAAAGVGTLGLMDGDKVDLSNLQRQVIHYTEDVDRHKVDSAAEKLVKINPDVTVKPYHTRLTPENASEILSEYDFVVDGSDNFPTKFLVNDACVLEGKPYSHAGILRFDGQAITYVPGRGACYRCIFPDLPPAGVVPSCSAAGILGAVAGILGTVQALEVLKFIIGKGDLLTGRLFVFDTLQFAPRIVNIKRNPDCRVCGTNPDITRLDPDNYIETQVCDLKS